jgi:hypothetical protein
MAAKLLDCTYNILTFVFRMPINMLANVSPEINKVIKGPNHGIKCNYYIKSLASVRVVDLQCT